MFGVKLLERCDEGIESVFHVHVADITPHLVIFIQRHLGLFQPALLVPESVTARKAVNVGLLQSTLAGGVKRLTDICCPLRSRADRCTLPDR